MAQEKSIKALLKDLEPDELREVIVELCKLSPKNKQFLELYLQGSSEADLNSILEDAKKKLHAHFYGRSQLPKLDGSISYFLTLVCCDCSSILCRYRSKTRSKVPLYLAQRSASI